MGMYRDFEKLNEELEKYERERGMNLKPVFQGDAWDLDALEKMVLEDFKESNERARRFIMGQDLLCNNRDRLVRTWGWNMADQSVKYWNKYKNVTYDDNAQISEAFDDGAEWALDFILERLDKALATALCEGLVETRDLEGATQRVRDYIKEGI